MMGINAVKGVEIGAGFAAVAQKGTEHGDEMTPEGFLTQQRRRHPRRHLHRPGHRGQYRRQADFQHPTAAAFHRQARRADRGRDHGRHDPCVGIRATPIAEAMLALVLMDHALRHRAQNADVQLSTPRIAARAPVAAATPAIRSQATDPEPDEA